MKRSADWESEPSCQDLSTLDLFISSHLTSTDSDQILVALSVLSSLTQSDIQLSRETLQLIGNTLRGKANAQIESECLSCLLNISQLNHQIKLQILDLNFLPPFLSAASLPSVLASMPPESLGEEVKSEISKAISILYEFSDGCNYFLVELASLLESACQNQSLFGLDLFEQLSLYCFLNSLDNQTFKAKISIPISQFSNTPAFIYLAGILLLNGGSSLPSLQAFFCTVLKEPHNIIPFMTVIVNYTRLELENSLSIDSLFTFLKNCNFTLEIFYSVNQLEDSKIMIDWFDFYSTLFTNKYFDHLGDQFEAFFSNSLIGPAMEAEQTSNGLFTDSLLQLLRSILLVQIISLDPKVLNWLMLKTEKDRNVYALGILNILAKNNVNVDETTNMIILLLNCNSQVVANNLEFYCECLDGIFDVFGDDTKDAIWFAKQFSSLLSGFRVTFGAVLSNLSRREEIYAAAKETLETLDDFIAYMNKKL